MRWRSLLNGWRRSEPPLPRLTAIFVSPGAGAPMQSLVSVRAFAGQGLAGDRYSEAELRAIVINSKEVFGEQTFMPAMYRIEGLKIPREKFAGKPILTAQEVEDVVAYLLTLKE